MDTNDVNDDFEEEERKAWEEIMKAPPRWDLVDVPNNRDSRELVAIE